MPEMLEKEREAEVVALFQEREKIMERLRAIDLRMKSIIVPGTQTSRKKLNIPLRDIIRTGRVS